MASFLREFQIVGATAACLEKRMEVSMCHEFLRTCTYVNKQRLSIFTRTPYGVCIESMKKHVWKKKTGVRNAHTRTKGCEVLFAGLTLMFLS